MMILIALAATVFFAILSIMIFHYGDVVHRHFFTSGWVDEIDMVMFILIICSGVLSIVSFALFVVSIVKDVI